MRGGRPTGRAGAIGALVVALLALTTVVVPAGGASAHQVDPRTYRPPVDAPVIDPFRPPPEPWQAGNRGIEYATEPGTLVRAIGPGVVSFAGPVAGSLHVTVRHPDGLRSTASFLAAVRTAVGRRVAGGEVIGVAAARLHLGVRRPDDTYLDPASLWGTRVAGGQVHLVPLDGRPGTTRGRGPGSAGSRAGGPATWADVGGRAVAVLGAAAPVATLVSRPATRWTETTTSARFHPRSSSRQRRVDATEPGFAQPWVRRGP